jgi:hypothetical protein
MHAGRKTVEQYRIQLGHGNRSNNFAAIRMFK